MFFLVISEIFGLMHCRQIYILNPYSDLLCCTFGYGGGGGIARSTNKLVLEKSLETLSNRSSHMITFWLDNGVVITLRTSGTEPKIKYYTEYCAK
jgi:hypothetical protein